MGENSKPEKLIATDRSMADYWETAAPPDWSTDFAEGEWARLLAWYSTGHGYGDMRFDPFIPLMHHLRPDAVKRYRLVLDSVCRGYGLAQPMRAIMPLLLHHYAIMRYQTGMRYELNGTRRMGISKGEVSDILALAWLHASNPVMNEFAEAHDEYMYMWGPDWESVEEAPGFQWDAGWTVDNEAFRCGIDFSVPHENALLPGELEQIEEWHYRVEGDVPSYVRHAAKYYPLQLLSYRARFETTVNGHLPKQFIAVTRLVLAAMWHEPAAARRALSMARYFGTTRDQAVQALAFAQVHGSDIGLESTFAAVDDILDKWDS
jgi:hypothetical protein